MRNQVQLITYANRFGGSSLRELNELLHGSLQGLFGGVHVLPFFLPVDGADAGFDPIDHVKVDPKIGDWSDVAALSRNHEVMADVIVNHISADSAQFRDYLKNGDRSPFRRLFLTRDDVFQAESPDGDVAKVYRPRPGLPFTQIAFDDGTWREFWTTFTSQQIDLNVASEEGRTYLDSVLCTLHQAGVRTVRLDAVGYAVKKAGTSCFMIPETFAFIDELSARAREFEMEVLVEVHSHYKQQIEIAACVDRVYDFALPPLVLHAFAFRTSRYLKKWIRIRPTNAVTVLDTHDGIGIVDIGAADDGRLPGLVPPHELDQLVEDIHAKTCGQSRLATGQAASNLDLYQVNTSFYDAMGRDDGSYLLARAIQFFLPGVPQVYYVGLMAGMNDMELLSRTGVGRDINRHYYSRTEVEQNLDLPVVRDLCDLIRFRNLHPAFQGEFFVGQTADDEISLTWRKDKQFATLVVNFLAGAGELRCSTDGGCKKFTVHQGRAGELAAFR